MKGDIFSVICAKKEYECRLSKKCIPVAARCDGHFDCDRKEDELDCIALSDGRKVHIDVNLRPSLNHKGIVSKNTKGEWNVMCVNRLDVLKNGAEMAGQICSILGFSGYSFYNTTAIAHVEKKKEAEKQTLQMQPRFAKHLHTVYDYEPHGVFRRHQNSYDFWSEVHDDMKHDVHFSEIVGAPKKRCFGMYIECVPHTLIPVVIPVRDVIKPVKPIKPVIQPDKVPVVVVPFHNKTIHESKKPETSIVAKEEHWTWGASVLINGKLSCIGVLLDRVWVLVESSCVKDIIWERDIIVVILGLSHSTIKTKSPFEQIKPVDCTRDIPGSNVILLHLFSPAQFNRYTFPVHLMKE